MVNYSNGKIYKITGGGLTYIGSTTQPLYKRLNEHRSQNNASKVIFNFDDCCITLIEDFPCERKEQLLARERYYYDLLDCVNKHKPWMSEEEKKIELKTYKEENKEIIRAKDKIRSKKRRELNPKCHQEYYEEHKESILSKKKEDYEKEKDSILAKKRERFTCCCGIETSIGYKYSHYKSKHHLDFLAEKLDPT